MLTNPGLALSGFEQSGSVLISDSYRQIGDKLINSWASKPLVYVNSFACRQTENKIARL